VDVIALSDRILVARQGTIIEEMSTDEATEQKISTRPLRRAQATALNFKSEVMDEYRQRRELGRSVAARRRRG
jgi:ABC-type sugar transport system ATPase subunit